MSDWDKVAVITGASSGIGAALAELIGSRRAKSVLVARREADLATVAARSGKALAVVADYFAAEDLAAVESRPPFARR